MDLVKRNKELKDFFDEKIYEYDNVHSIFMDTKKMLATHLDENTLKVLDLGAGTGLELVYLFERFPYISVTAIDLSMKMLEKIRERYFKNKVKIICANFFDIPFDHDYDAVISTSALHHFLKSDKINLYKKVYECLNNNGQFINADKFVWSSDEEEACLKEYENNPNNKKHVDTPLFIDNEISILEDVGYKDIEIIDTPYGEYKLVKARKRGLTWKKKKIV